MQFLDYFYILATIAITILVIFDYEYCVLY